jgi:hypothetical protein
VGAGEGVGPGPGVGGEGFAADGWENAQLNQALAVEGGEDGEFGVVGGDEGGVVEGFVQPGAEWLEAAEIDAPAAFVQRVGHEGEAERQCVAVQVSAMGLPGLPLAEAAGEAFGVVVGFHYAPASAAGAPDWVAEDCDGWVAEGWKVIAWGSYNPCRAAVKKTGSGAGQLAERGIGSGQFVDRQASQVYTYGVHIGSLCYH